jgi:hypothetical protein
MVCTGDSRLRPRRHEFRRARTVIIPVGEIDLDNREHLRSVLEATDGDLIVDLTGVTFSTRRESECSSTSTTESARMVVPSAPLPGTRRAPTPRNHRPRDLDRLRVTHDGIC